jgi:hypothetical protein
LTEKPTSALKRTDREDVAVNIRLAIDSRRQGIFSNSDTITARICTARVGVEEVDFAFLTACATKTEAVFRGWKTASGSLGEG